MNIKRKRISVLVNVWSKILKEGITSREIVVDLLRRSYEEAGVEPIRGSSFSPDIYDKDMASLYIVGKLGLGIDKELDRTILDKIFPVETMIEGIVDKILKVSDYEELCRSDENICKALDDKLVARILRYVFTLYYFGFIDKNTFFSFMRKAYQVLKPMEETIRRFAKFVIAYEVGRKISENEVKNKLDINMVKNTVALEIGIPNALPSLGYIADVAKHFFELPHNLVNSLKSKNS